MAFSRQQRASSFSAIQASATEAAVRKAYESGSYSDLIISCHGQQFKVHKLILCGQSEWFVNATKPDAFEEGTTNIIAMDDDNPEAIKAMLDVLYKGTYDINIGTTQTPDTNNEMPLLMKHLRIYALADRLQITTLKDQARSHTNDLMTHCWNQPTFCEAVKLAYSIAPPGNRGLGLRNSALSVCAAHAGYLFNDAEGKFEALVAEVPEFAMDLLKWMASHGQPVGTMACRPHVTADMFSGPMFD